MSGIILVSLMIIPLSALLTGALYFRKNVKHIHVQLFFIAAISGLFYDQFVFYNSFRQFIENQQWEAIAMYMAYTPLIATAVVFAVALLATTLLSLFFKIKKSSSPLADIKITQAVVIVLFSLITIVTHKIFYENVTAQNELFGQLSDPNTPADVLREQANTVSIQNKLALAKNPNLPDDVFLKLIQDKTDMVRYVLVSHPKTTKEQLEVFKTDMSKDVRKAADEELNRRNSTTK